MRTIQEVLAELRQLATQAQQGADVSARQADVQQELAQLGYVPQQPPAGAPANPYGPDNPVFALAAHAYAQQQRSGSRFAGPNADPEALRHLAAGGSFAPDGSPLAPGQGLPPGWQLSAPPGSKAPGVRGTLGTLAGTMTKALAEATPSAGGVLVPEEVSREIVTLVRNRVAVMQMGPTIVPVAKELELPYISTGSAAYYVQENARIPVTEPTFALVPKLKPMELAALLPVSNRLLRDAATNPTLEDALRNDMAGALAGRQDLAFLQGLGEGNEPLGVRNQAEMTRAPELGRNGEMPELSDFQKLVGAVRSINAPFSRPGWIFHPDVLTWLETLTDSTGRPLLEGGLLRIDPSGGGGTFLNYRFQTTGTIPTELTVGASTDCTYVVFGSDWNEAWVGENLDLLIESSNDATYSPDGGTTHISAWQQRQTVFRALSAHDFALRRPEYFTVMEGVRLP